MILGLVVSGVPGPELHKEGHGRDTVFFWENRKARGSQLARCCDQIGAGAGAGARALSIKEQHDTSASANADDSERAEL